MTQHQLTEDPIASIRYWQEWAKTVQQDPPVSLIIARKDVPWNKIFPYYDTQGRKIVYVSLVHIMLLKRKPYRPEKVFRPGDPLISYGIPIVFE